MIQPIRFLFFQGLVWKGRKFHLLLAVSVARVDAPLIVVFHQAVQCLLLILLQNLLLLG